ncbi:MAG: DNA (cytosine-5-)-methyltransferase [Bacilli bacterium]|nr:DNA (cytosine-5-)-methyltransferase [Bacilli bacterium]
MSVGGKRQLMGDTSTRSGMLWEVERLLTECKEKPQVLLMENVVQVHGEGAVQDFNKWQLRLEELGYKNYWEDLVATDYGIPQSRNRCFMVSILGDYSYSFPPKQELKLKLKDLLEPNVDEKYYLSDKLIDCFMSEKSMGTMTRKERFLQNINRENQDIANTLTTLEGNRATDTFIVSKHLRETLEQNNEITDGAFIDAYNRKIRNNNLAATLTTRINDGNDTFVAVNEVSMRIRKLTPKECFRLMGVKDEDYEKIAKNQSNASLYHLAGDSIVVDVIKAIFKEML